MVKKYIGYGVLIISILLSGVGAWAGAVKHFAYPIETKVTLRYLMETGPNLEGVYNNFGETILARELQKRTGVKCKYLHPPAGRTREILDVMAAAQELPDIMENAWNTFPGGPNTAMNHGYIKRLNAIWAVAAPNLTAWLKNNPEWDKQIKTDEGDYYVFPFIRSDDRLLVSSGPVIRKDWLDELKLSYPETPDDWYLVLKAFKEKQGALAPLSMNLRQLQTDVACGFDVCGDQQGFYVEDAKVKFSLDTPQYKQFLMTMNRWFAEGLLDSGFANLTNKARDLNILNGKAGIVDAPAGSGIGVWMKTMKKRNPQFEVTGIKFATPRRGQKAKFARRCLGFGGTNGGSAALGSKCKNVEIAARMLDYNYSPEGSLLLNFGIENVSYKMVGGSPTFTPLITRDPKLPMAKVLAGYARANASGPFIQDARYIDQYYYLPQQREGQKRWMDNDYRQYMLPALTPNDQESLQFAQIMNDIDSYIAMMSIRFIMGVESFDHYENYVQRIQDMGLKKALKIYQKAYKRFLKR